MTTTSSYRSYYYPRVAGIERQDKCEDPDYQRVPHSSHFYPDNRGYSIRPVNTYYPPATVCYVDKSAGGLRIIALNEAFLKIYTRFNLCMKPCIIDI